MSYITAPSRFKSATQLLALAVIMVGSTIGIFQFFGQPAVQYTHPETGAIVSFFISRSPLISTNGCFEVTWQSGGIDRILLDDDPTVGNGTQEICGKPYNYQPRLRVFFTDGSRTVMTLPQESNTLSLLLACLGALSLSLLSGAFLALGRWTGMVFAWLLIPVAVLLLILDFSGIRDLSNAMRLGLNLSLGPLLARGLIASRRDLSPRARFTGVWMVMITMWPIPVVYSIPHGLAVSGVPYLEIIGLVLAAILYGSMIGLVIYYVYRNLDKYQQRFSSALLALSGFVLSLVMVEGGLRFFTDLGAPPQDQEQLSLAVPTDEGTTAMEAEFEWWTEYPSDPRNYFEDGNRVYYRTNAAGYRDTAFTTEREPGVARVALIGDSFAFGQGVHRKDTVDTVIENTLRDDHDCEAEVYNFAVAGYDAASYSTVMTEDILDYDPDVVLIWYFLNDIGIAKSRYFEEALDQPNPYFPMTSPFLVSARVVSQRLQEFSRAELGTYRFLSSYANDAEWEQVTGHLDVIATAAEGAEIDYGLFVHPVLFRLNRYPYASIHQQVITAADERGYFTADLHPVIASYLYTSLWVHPADSHSNEFSNQFTGAYAAEQLVPHLPGCGAQE